MQLDGRQAEREALRLIPAVLSELFDELHEGFQLHPLVTIGQGPDLVGEGFGRRWVFEVKASSNPGLVRTAAEQIAGFEEADDVLAVLVVPYMTPAGAKVAAQYGLNWIDLSGNANIRADSLYISVRCEPNQFSARGRPSSPFAPRSSRVTRVMLLDPTRGWRQKELASVTHLNSGQVSRIVRRLREDELIEEDEGVIRPRDPDLLLDAWSDEYRFDRHEVVRGHASGAGIEVTRELGMRLLESDSRYAFTGLPAAWLFGAFARFRLNSVYVDGDPRELAEELGLRQNERGANVELIVPDDEGIFAGSEEVDEIECVSRVQTYLDLRHLPERSGEAADHLRESGLWHGDRR